MMMSPGFVSTHQGINELRTSDTSMESFRSSAASVMMRQVMAIRIGGKAGFRRRRTAIEALAATVFKLNGGVADAMLLAEQVVDLVQNTGARGGRNVGDCNVTGKRARLRTKAPDVKIVDV